jgi:hypothetical protein
LSPGDYLAQENLSWDLDGRGVTFDIKDILERSNVGSSTGHEVQLFEYLTRSGVVMQREAWPAGREALRHALKFLVSLLFPSALSIFGRRCS